MPIHFNLTRNSVSQHGAVAHHKDEAYALLQTEPFETDSTDNNQPSTLPRYSVSATSIAVVLLCAACTAINWYLCIAYPLISGKLSATDLRSVSREQYSTLRRPSPFIGFEGISRSSPPISRTLINYPATIALVNSSRPEQIFSDDPKQHMTATGSVSPEERLVMLTNTISTIFQFRAMDYGMERCEFNFRISPATTAMSSKSPEIAVYRLASDHPLDTKKLSYSNRPNRIFTVGTVSITPSSAIEWSHAFRCLWDSISTFEIAYLGQGVEGFDLDEDLSIQWWQDKKEVYPEQGVYLIQRESV